jgi:ABC-type sulfate transport system substrate-binding protein
MKFLAIAALVVVLTARTAASAQQSLLNVSYDPTRKYA